MSIALTATHPSSISSKEAPPVNTTAIVLDSPVSTDVAAPPETAVDHSDTGTVAPGRRVTFGRVASSEWLKFRTVRSNVIALGGAAAAAIGFGALFASLAGTDDSPGRLADNALSLSLGGFNISQLIVAILGVALVAGEYQTGLIRTWFGAAPDRIRVLFGKVGVYGSVVFVVTLAAAVLAFLAGQAVYADPSAALSLTDDGVMQALVGTAFYGAAIGVMGVALGFLLRSTAAGASAVVSILMIAPLMVSLLPSSIGDPIGKVLPSNAGSAMSGIASTADLLSSGWGFAALCTWVVVMTGAAAVSLRMRDA